MKKNILIIMILLLLPTFVSANEIGEFKRTINLSLNCDYCKEGIEKSATFQLFANDEIVEDAVITLDESNEFKGSFKDLAVFDENNVEINYEIKKLENKEYKSIPKDEITHEKTPIKKWVQVMPEDIKPGHEYVLFTDNWNHEQNGYGKFVLINGNMYLEEIEAVAEYNNINGKKSYYTLTSNPSEKSIWSTSNVSKDDEEFDTFKDYFMFNSYQKKKLTLSGYNKGDWIHWIFKQSEKEGYYIEEEDAWYTNKVEIIPVEGTIGRFYIASQNINEYGDLSPKHYIGIDHFYKVVAQTEPDYSAQFLAFEYVEEEVETVNNLDVGVVLCAKDELEETKEEVKVEKDEKNPETDNGIFTIAIIALSVSSLIIIALRKKFLF